MYCNKNNNTNRIHFINNKAMSDFSKQEIEDVWSQGLIIEGWNPDIVRQDAAGAWILREKYGDHDSIFGWDIDHIYPQNELEKLNVPQELINNRINLRPMNWKNNISKSNDYPEYRSVLKSSDKTNVEDPQYKIVNEKKQQELKEFYKKYFK